MRILFLLLFPIFLSAQINNAYGVIEIGGFPTSSATGPKFAYRPADSSFYRWVSGSTWVKIIPDEPDTLYLKQLSGTTALVDGDTIDISTYFLKSDTTSAFASYLKRPVGWGLSLLTGKYPFVDSSKVASRYYVSTSPTTIAANYAAISNGTNLVARNLFDNNTYVGILNSKPFIFGSQSVAGLPAGVDGYWLDVSDYKWPARYNTTAGAWIYPTQDSRAGGIGSVNGAIHFNSSAFRTTESSTFTQLSNKLTLGVPSGKNPMVDIVTGTGDGTVNESAGFRLRNRTNDGNTFYLQMGTSNVGAGGSNQGFAYMQSGMWGGAYTNPLFINRKGGFVGFGEVFTAEWELSVKNAIGINAPAFPPALGQGGKLVFSTNKGLNAPAGIYAWYDQAAWYQGCGLVFKTESGADVSGAANQGIERMRISSDGKIAIGTTSPQRLFHVEGEARVTDLTTDTPTRIVGADADGDLGAITVSTGLSLSGGNLTATGATTWLKTELEASQDVNIAGGSSTDFRIQNTSIQFDGRVKFGADSVFTYDPVQDTFFIGGNGKFGKQPTDDSFIDYSFRNLSSGSTAILIESGRAPGVSGTAQLVLRPTGTGSGAISYGNTSGGNQLGIFSDAKADFVAYFGSSSVLGGNSNTVLMSRIDDPVQWGYNGKLVVYDTISSGKALFLAKKVSSSSTPIAMFSSAANDRFTFNDDGTTRFHVYGTPATTAAALSKTLSNYGAGFATDGTVTSREIKRDTTIYVVDADYDFSAALTTAQVSARYNRVIFLMTTTAAAGSDSELTLHTPDVNLMQCEYLVRSTDEAGGFSNKIVFGSNNAVDSTNGLVTNYFPAAGQGVGIRAGLRSGVYKYWYY